MNLSSIVTFDQFNARTLPPEKVAKTFIPPDQFKDICAHSHTTIIGPRGSGKTSLLKMLHPAALSNWEGGFAETIKRSISYTGVLIPSDITWNKQTLSFVEGLPVDEQRTFKTAAFTARVLHELLSVMIYRLGEPDGSTHVFRQSSLTRETEREIVTQMAEAFSLKLRTYTLRAIKHALTARNIEIWQIAQERHVQRSKDIPSWMFLDFFSCATYAIELYDDAINEGSGTWALLFDEVELLPEWLLNGLMTAFRSTNEKILFKLAISPFDERYENIRTALESMPDQDYKEIILWHPNKEEGHMFSQLLFQGLCHQRGIEISSVSDLLGPSLMEEGRDSNAYKFGSIQYDILHDALQLDGSFKRYWSRFGLNLEKIDQLPEWERASRVRKVYPIVAIRMFFRRFPSADGRDPRQRLRGRKNREIYSGGDSVLSITEGNPRWIIGIARLLIENSKSDSRPIAPEIQAMQIEEAGNRFRARIRTISLAPLLPQGRETTLLEFIDILGTYFQQRVLGDKFLSEPPLSFEVDENTNSNLQLAIGRAVNVGALVHLPQAGRRKILNSVKGERFRLSYMLAPYYKIPMRIGYCIKLSKILEGVDADQEEFLPFLA